MSSEAVSNHVFDFSGGEIATVGILISIFVVKLLAEPFINFFCSFSLSSAKDNPVVTSNRINGQVLSVTVFFLLPKADVAMVGDTSNFILKSRSEMVFINSCVLAISGARSLPNVLPTDLKVSF